MLAMTTAWIAVLVSLVMLLLLGEGWLMVVMATLTALFVTSFFGIAQRRLYAQRSRRSSEVDTSSIRVLVRSPNQSGGHN